MSRSSPILLINALTLAALLIHGYHPYSEDGGLYVAGVERLLNPRLFPAYPDFVTEHLRFSLFAPCVAALVRLTHIPLTYTLLALHLATLWLTLFAAWLLTTRITSSAPARTAAVTLLALWLTLPIAGTSLLLFDPYLTARSLTTPLALLAMALTLRVPHPKAPALSAHRVGYRAKLDSLLFHPHLLILTLLTAATVLHPLMAAYTLAAILVLFLCHSEAKPRNLLLSLPLPLSSPLLLLVPALLTAAALQHFAPPESPAYLPIALSRYYWFPFWWHWYEQLGLIAPIAVLYALRHRAPILTRALLTLAAISLTVAALFARVHLQTHLVARLQPLRAFQLIYILMILLLGAWLGDRILHTHPLRWAALLLTLAPLMFYVQRQTYPASPHLELPWTPAINPYVQAFQWARINAPTDALFALDPHYITAAGEDAQNFRPIAQRSALPDYSKDGGEAAITPSLTAAWTQAQTAQANLNTQPDAIRLQKLKPLGVTWLVLTTNAPTAFPCPYTNPSIKLCALRAVLGFAQPSR